MSKSQLQILTVGRFVPVSRSPLGRRAVRRGASVVLPVIHLQGRWLVEAGFTVGAQVRVMVECGRLMLEVMDEK
jgi:hypothetical protein